MPSVFRPYFHSVIFEPATRTCENGKEFVRFKMPKTGKFVTGEVMPSGKAKIEVQFWYTRVKGKKVALRTTDKDTATSKAADEQRKADREHAGLGNLDRKAKQLGVPLAKHIEPYKSHLESNGYSPDHIAETIALIKRICAACEFAHIENMAPVWLNRYLADLINKGKSYRTRNKALHAIKALIHYLQDTQVMEVDPMRSIKDLNVELDSRRTRRALTNEEFQKLIIAAQNGKVVQGTDGPTRAILYSLVVTCGLRAKEVALLSISDLVLTDDCPYIALPATIAKASRAEVMPLHEVVAGVLAKFVAGRPRNSRVFPTLMTESGKLRLTNRMLKADCKASGVPYKGECGGFADFHALRTTFITNTCHLTDSFTATKLSRHTKANHFG